MISYGPGAPRTTAGYAAAGRGETPVRDEKPQMSDNLTLSGELFPDTTSDEPPSSPSAPNAAPRQRPGPSPESDPASGSAPERDAGPPEPEWPSGDLEPSAEPAWPPESKSSNPPDMSWGGLL